MLRDRIVVALLLIPFGFWVISDGGWAFAATIVAILGLAAREYGRLFNHHTLRPAGPLIVGGVLLLSVTRWLDGFHSGPLVLSLICLSAMAWHMIDFERGAARSGTDFAITLGGVLYLGWVGSYLISLRQIPGGAWWFLLALPAVWLADSAAYFVGRAVGRHRLAPRLSPKKSWEGYLAGIVVGALTGTLFALLWGIAADPRLGLNPERGMLVGAVVGALAPLGDLGVSMIKREAVVKDSGSLLPGHGGMLDRIDSWLWAGVLSYYLVTWLTA